MAAAPGEADARCLAQVAELEAPAAPAWWQRRLGEDRGRPDGHELLPLDGVEQPRRPRRERQPTRELSPILGEEQDRVDVVHDSDVGHQVLATCQGGRCRPQRRDDGHVGGWSWFVGAGHQRLGGDPLQLTVEDHAPHRAAIGRFADRRQPENDAAPKWVDEQVGRAGGLAARVGRAAPRAACLTHLVAHCQGDVAEPLRERYVAPIAARRDCVEQVEAAVDHVGREVPAVLEEAPHGHVELQLLPIRLPARPAHEIDGTQPSTLSPHPPDQPEQVRQAVRRHPAVHQDPTHVARACVVRLTIEHRQTECPEVVEVGLAPLDLERLVVRHADEVCQLGPERPALVVVGRNSGAGQYVQCRPHPQDLGATYGIDVVLVVVGAEEAERLVALLRLDHELGGQ